MLRKRRLKPGDLTDLRRVIWKTIVEVESLLEARPPSTDVVLKSAHCLAQLSMAYTKLLDETTFDERLTRLEQQLARERISANGQQ
jgi:hypothetical protein